MATELTVGPHQVCIDGDTVLIRWMGTPEYDHVRAIHLHYEQALATYGRLFAINDMRHSGMPSSQTRKWIAEWALRYQSVIVVTNFGASLAIRAIQMMVLRGLALLGNRPALEVVHFGSEAETLAWIEVRRRQLSAKEK